MRKQIARVDEDVENWDSGPVAGMRTGADAAETEWQALKKLK